MNVQHWWSDTDSRTFGETPQCDFFHNKSYMNGPAIELGTARIKYEN